MKLTEDQITTIKSWIESGDDLGKIQNQINESFDINLTYLETRFLLSDLKIELNENEERMIKNKNQLMSLPLKYRIRIMSVKILRSLNSKNLRLAIWKKKKPTRALNLLTSMSA